LVQSHLHAPQKLAAGIAILPSAGSSFAATQAAWRFLNNLRVTLFALIKPMREAARRQIAESQPAFVILAEDWCKSTFDDASNKSDLAQLTHDKDVGYEMTAALLLNGDNGNPMALMEMHVKTGNGVLSTRPNVRDQPHLEQILPTMNASRRWGLAVPVLHVIDREADSIGHFRQWDSAGHRFMVRADDRLVKWNDRPCLLSEIAGTLRRKQAFSPAGTAEYLGRPVELWVAETEVVLYRPAKRNVRGKRKDVPGRPLPLRFAVAEVRSDSGKTLAVWLLLSNAPRSRIATDHLARCYYWRWRIESFFKLLKSHGMHLEQWRQQSGPAIARRLLVAAMACVVVWQLQADHSLHALELKNVLVRLSGRQTKRKRPHTAPALLAGLWVLLSMLELLEYHPLAKLRRLARRIPYLDTG
jgi:hypothetical protein